MRKWTTSACVLAWCIPTLVAAVAVLAPARPAQANTRIASNNPQVTVARAAPAAGPAAPRPAAGRYVVQPGDTLSVIASAVAVRGGWQALYVANKRAIGPDPNLIRPGTILILPGRAAPPRYTVQAGDTLSGIAAALGLRGWQVLYAANKTAIGPDPDVIRPGMVLVPPLPAARAPAPPAPAGHHKPTPPAPPATPPATATPMAPATPPATAPGTARPARPVPGIRPTTRTPGKGAHGSRASGSGVPPWLAVMLLAVALLIAAAFLVEPALAIGRRRRAAATARRRVNAHAGQELDAGKLAADRARIILADHDRLIVTYSQQDDTVYVLTPPGEDPRAVLRAARLILPEDAYQELAGHLGVEPTWPMECLE